MGTYLNTSFREPTIERVSWGPSVSLLHCGITWAGVRYCLRWTALMAKLIQHHILPPKRFAPQLEETFCFQKEFSLSLTLHAFHMVECWLITIISQEHKPAFFLPKIYKKWKFTYFNLANLALREGSEWFTKAVTLFPAVATCVSLAGNTASG